jgi:hypothetical protein
VTLATSTQSATDYVVTVSGVTRAADGEPLTDASEGFTGTASFNVTNAESIGNTTVTVTFDAAPDPVAAVVLGNYSVPGLALSGTPVLGGNTVTITTAEQSATTYVVTVSGVTRDPDGEPLTEDSHDFVGTGASAPTVTNVEVTATSPDNGTVPYNTGTVTVKLTGTAFSTVTCPSGVKLDDLDGAGSAVNTGATSCTVDGDTKITATFPAFIRSNGTAGWNVQVTNQAGTNMASAVKLAPKAGLLISEVYTGTSGATDHEYVEVYNPTATSIDPVALAIRLHTRSSTGTDTSKTLTHVTANSIPSHGFLLFVSSQSTALDAWFASRDYTYSASSADLVGNGGVYISSSTSAGVKVIDKVGWGTQPAGGREGTAVANIASNVSAERLPGDGQGGHAADSDDNSADFKAPSATLSPHGTADATQP